MSQKHSRRGPFTKRQVLQMLGGTAAAGLAGCSGGDESSTEDTADSADGQSGGDDTTTNSDSSGEDMSAVEGGTLQLGVDTSLQSMDPRTYGGLVSLQVYCNLYSQVLQWHQVEDGYELRGDLAESWGWEEDTEFVIELREEAEFWNGDSVNADHVVYTFQSLKDDPSLSVGSDFKLDLMEPEKIDDTTVLINTEEPIGSLEASLGYSLGIVHQEVDQERDIRFDPMGSGPFVLEEQTDSEVILEANEDYWKTDDEGNQLPYLDRVEFQMFSESQPKINALGQGELDFVDTVPVADVEQLESNDETQIIMGDPGGRRGIVHFNVTEPPFDDKYARQAILHMMDWQTLTEGIWNGYAQKAGSQATPSNLGWDNAAEDPYEGVDVEAAEEAIEQSQYEKEDFQFTNILRNSDNEVNRAQQVILDDISSELGIDYGFEQLDDESWRSQNHSNEGYGFTVMDWSGGWDPDHFIKMAWSEEYFNWGGYANEEVDELFNQAVLSHDHEEREEMYRELNELILEDAGKYFAYWYPDIQGARANVHGLQAGLGLKTYFEQVWKEE